MPQKAAPSQVTKTKERKFSELFLAAMIMAIESEYDVICDDDGKGHIIVLRNNQHLKIDIVTGEETPAPDYDKGKCPCCQKKTNIDSDYFIFRRQ